MKKIFAFIPILCLVYSFTIAQSNPLEYGISFGINMQRPTITLTNWKKKGLDELKSLDIIPGYGFQLGISGIYKLSENFGIRINPSFDFTKSSVEFTEVLNKISIYTIENVGIQIPVRLEWASTSGKYRPTISMGASYFRSFVYTEKKTPFALKLNDVASQIAIGVKMDMKAFNMIPQLVYSNGLTNLEPLDYDLYTRAIHSWNNQVLAMQIIFEGK